MPSTSRPRVTGSSSGIGRISANTPMSERQQMALLMQMTSANNQSDAAPGNSGHGPARSRDRNERGETAMHVAAIKGDQEGIKKLLEQGMSPNVPDFAGWTPLHEACNHGHYNVALTLVKAGANVNARGLDDDTPLHDAAITGQLRLVKMLVERGADPCFKNRKGKTPCDVAAAAVHNFLITARDAAISRQQQMKKASDGKKSMDDHDESNVASGSGTTSKAASKEEDDVYEFKTTPKDSSSSSGDDKSDGGKGSDKSSDEKSDEQGTKRSYSDIEGDVDDEVKRKKRNTEGTSKDLNKTVSNRPTSQRQEKNSKFHGAAAKNSNLTSKNVSTLDRKSPCTSPKPTSTKTDSDVEMDDKNLGSDSFGAAGPKVPPLKIVIPQQTSNPDQEMGTRNGKNISTRNNAALPYVVASSSNSNDSADKESASSRCTSPSDSTKSVDEKKTGTTMTNEDQKQQRVLRSSNRGGSSVDRGSNNSSPQLQSSSPSPAPVTQTSTTTTATSTNTTSSVTARVESTKPATPASSSTVDSCPTTSNMNTTSPSNPLNTETEQTNAPSPSASSTSSTKESSQNTADLHPRKRKIRASKDENKQIVPNTNSSSSSSSSSSTTQSNTNNNDPNESTTNTEVPHPHDQPITNCYQMYLNIRKQIERRQRNLFPVQPKPPQGFKDYLLNRRTYVLAGKTTMESNTGFPMNLSPQLRDLFMQQEKERHKLKMQHVVEKEKLVLSVEQEILRVHGRAARALANQSLPFSACTILKDEEVYNIITPEQEEKDRNARSRYNGRLFLSWLQDVDDKWEKIKEAMVLRCQNEAESLHAVQKMEWEWKMKELMLCEYKAQPVIDEIHVPMVHVSDDFDLLP
ncbi:ankyrin repeat domain-containing protein 11 isoform X2 [Sitodiplosis mosellana]|nr:ankyrin repeat domain-containing protein 11 isoform X2 [Sitodiplosis mosellana]XP_055315386.1 ankyrin repeat domain-containing protein 11 isoform X2 [Sitodiplosis mosellana]XP_055315387.1 ankyrin repeat domain-containing protein 11 isoform X2 [Sitodiplosis mosellana]